MINSKAETFNDGLVSIYSVADVAAPGTKPVKGLTLKRSLRYSERTVGISRFYAAKQAGVKVDYVLRCPRLRDVSTQDIAVPADGQQYEIVQVQYPQDVEPPVMDLSLSAVSSVYAIYQPGEVPDSEPIG